MKNIILILTVLMSSLMFSQNNLNGLSTQKLNFDQKINLKLSNYSYGESTIKTGPAMLIGGGAMFLGALLTVPAKEWHGIPDNPPYIKSTPRFVGMTMGIVTFSVGFVVTIGGS